MANRIHSLVKRDWLHRRPELSNVQAPALVEVSVSESATTETDAWAKCPSQDQCRADLASPCLACWEDAGDSVAGLRLAHSEATDDYQEKSRAGIRQAYREAKIGLSDATQMLMFGWDMERGEAIRYLGYEGIDHAT